MTPNDAKAQYRALRRGKWRKKAPDFARNSFKGFLSRFRFRNRRPSLVPAAVLTITLMLSPWLHPIPALAQNDSPDSTAATASIFPQIRALSLEGARALAMKRSPALALSGARVAEAEGAQRDVSRRIKLDTTGGLDPFSGQVRFYLALDLERLIGLNKGEKESARQKVEAEKINRTTSEQAAMARVSTAWYGLSTAQANVTSAGRRKEIARALYAASDARFKAGAGALNDVLGALSSNTQALDAYEASRQGVALACLELAQSCGYLTAEEMEAAL